MISDVALWFARNSKDEIVTINEIKHYHEDKYTCPLCNSEVIPKAIRDDAKVTEHFAHIDKSKCTPESMIHWWYKNKFLQSGDKFIVTTDKIHEYICKDILIEENHHTEYGDYKPDVTVITESGDTIYFEYAFTNQKKIKDYLNQWLELGNIVVEVNLKTLLQANYGKDIYKFNALFYKGKCFNTNNRDLYYKTIGEYKEQVYSGKTLDDDKKKEIEKLDWFWDSVQDYKLNKLNDEELYLCFDEANNINSNLVIDILSKSKCTDILNKCLRYCKEKQNSIFTNFVETINNTYNGKINIEYEIKKWGKSINVKSYLGGCEEIIADSYGGGDCFTQHDIDYINNQIKYHIQDIENKEHYQLTLNNIVLFNASQKINEYVKQINEKYSFDFVKNNNSYGGDKYNIIFCLNFAGGYSSREVLKIDLTDKNIRNSKSFEEIYLYFKTQIDEYRKDFVILDSRLYDIFISISDFYNKLNNKLNCRILYEAENVILLWFEKERRYDFSIRIKDNRFNNWDSSVRYDNNIKEIEYNTEGYLLDELTKIIKNLIVEKIRNKMHYGY